MNRSAIRSMIQALCLIVVLAGLAIPLSGLMVGDTNASTAVPVAELDQADATSPVSALMAGSAVGPSRGAMLKPRHPASAFVP